MKIISHRGYWIYPEEKNSVTAFQRSFNKKFGIETDIRDVHCQLVISHDIPGKDALLFSEILKLLGSSSLPLALNIKADGLAKILFEAVSQYPLMEYFVFDMSIPDMRLYLDLHMPVYGRMSDLEREVPWFELCTGIWLDTFHTIWYTETILDDLLKTNKKICVVSQELHHNDPSSQWLLLKRFSTHPNLMICTDIPEKARGYFGEEYD